MVPAELFRGSAGRKTKSRAVNVLFHHRIYATPWASSLRTSEEEVECGLAFGNFTFQPPGEAHFALPDGTNSPTSRFA